MQLTGLALKTVNFIMQIASGSTTKMNIGILRKK